MITENLSVSISVDADEYRVYWVAFVEDEDGVVVERRSFRSPEEAEEYAEYIRSLSND